MSSKLFVEMLQKIGASVLMKGELPPGIDLASFFQTFDDPIAMIETQLSAPDWDDRHADYHLAMTGLSALADQYFAERPPTAYNTELMNICHSIGRKRPAPPKKPDTGINDHNRRTDPNTAAPAAPAAVAAAASVQPAAAEEQQHHQLPLSRDVNFDDVPIVPRSVMDGSYDQVPLELLQISNVVQLVDRSGQMTPTPVVQQPSIEMSARELFFQQMRGVGEIEPVEDVRLGDFGESLLAAPEPLPNAIEPLLFGPPDVPDTVDNPQPEQPQDNGENAVPTLEPMPMERRRSRRRRRRRRRNSGDSLRLPRIVRPVSPPQQILQNIRDVLLDHANARERNANVEQQQQHQQPLVPVADGLQAPEQPPQPQQQPLSALPPQLEPLPMELDLESVPVPLQQEPLTDLRPTVMPLSPHVTLVPVPVPQVRVGRTDLAESAAVLLPLPPPPPPAERTPMRRSFMPSLTSTPHGLHPSMAVPPPPPPQFVDEPPQQVSHIGQRSTIRAVPALAKPPPPPPPPSDVVNVDNITLDVTPERIVFGAVVMSPPDDDCATEQQQHQHQWKRRSGRRVLQALRAPGESALCAGPLLQHVRLDGDRSGGTAAAAAEDGAAVVRQAAQTMCDMHNKRMLTLRSSAVDNTFDDVSMDGHHTIM